MPCRAGEAEASRAGQSGDQTVRTVICQPRCHRPAPRVDRRDVMGRRQRRLTEKTREVHRQECRRYDEFDSAAPARRIQAEVARGVDVGAVPRAKVLLLFRGKRSSLPGPLMNAAGARRWRPSAECGDQLARLLVHRRGQEERARHGLFCPNASAAGRGPVVSKVKLQEQAAPPSPRSALAVPPGAPRWVTADLIAKTIRVWQRYYPEPLTADDALSMIINVGNLFDVLGTESDRS